MNKSSHADMPDVPLNTVGDVTLNLATRATSAAVDAALDIVGLTLEAQAEGRQIAPHELRPLADAANESIQRANCLLIAAGGREVDMPAVRPVPLNLLSTPASQRLLALLEEAQAAAEAVDDERGRALDPDVPLLPGESRGTDLAESISYLTLRVRTEVLGPRGRE